MSKTSKIIIAIAALVLIIIVVMYSMRTRTVAVSNPVSGQGTYQVTGGGTTTFVAPTSTSSTTSGTSVPAGASAKMPAGTSANGDVSVLTANSWAWQQTSVTGSTTTVPTKPASFVLKFGTDGHISSSTDCNALTGTYTVADGSLTFGPLASTQMYCTGSQESGYTQNLADVTAYSINSSGDLVLALGGNEGSMTFKKQL